MTGSTTQTLFESIQYQDMNSLNIFLDNLKKEQALFILEEALSMAHRNGFYNLREAEAISKSLRILNIKV